MEQIAALIPSEHRARLIAHARANDRSLAAEVRRMVRMYLQAIETRPSVESVIETSRARAREPMEVP